MVPEIDKKEREGKVFSPESCGFTHSQESGYSSCDSPDGHHSIHDMPALEPIHRHRKYTSPAPKHLDDFLHEPARYFDNHILSLNQMLFREQIHLQTHMQRIYHQRNMYEAMKWHENNIHKMPAH